MLSRVNAAFESRLRVASATVGHADLTAATNGLQQDILLATLPAGAVLMGYAVSINTFFTGGAASAVTLALGTGQDGDPDLIMDELNIFDTTTNDAWIKGTAGILPEPAPLEGEVYMQFDVDAGHTLAGLTAGEVSVKLFYAVPDQNVRD